MAVLFACGARGHKKKETQRPRRTLRRGSELAGSPGVIPKNTTSYEMHRRAVGRGKKEKTPTQKPKKKKKRVHE